MNPIQDSNQLHNKAMKIKVQIRAGNDGYGPSNEIKGYYAIEGQQAPQAATPANGGAVAPPWANQGQNQNGNKPLPF